MQNEALATIAVLGGTGKEGGGLALRWKTEGDRPFPMPVQVRAGKRVVDLPMTGGGGRIALAAYESFTLDPHSKVLRELPHIADYQKDMAERAKATKR